MTPNFPNRVPLTHLPTPIEPLPRLSSFLKGSELYIKRDDLTGRGGGGNKLRKLEFLLAEAQSQECNHIITIGSPQSNHCRQTAAACAKLGLGCSLVLKGNPTAVNGNLLLDQLCGAHIYFTEERPPLEVIAAVAKQQQSLGNTPYIIPIGGSNVVGTTAYVKAMAETMDQLQAENLNIDLIVVASSSGGTQAGLVLGAHIYGFRGKIFGISIDRTAEDLKMQVGALATATAAHLGLKTVSLVDDVDVNDDYISPGYGTLTQVEQEAIQLLAQKEGIFLDPVYTGRAMGGLIDLIRWGAFTRAKKILFWHTGGQPALFAYAKELKK